MKDGAREFTVLVARSNDQGWKELRPTICSVPGARIVGETIHASRLGSLAYQLRPTVVVASSYIGGVPMLSRIMDLHRRASPASKLIVVGNDFASHDLLIYMSIGVDSLLLWRDFSPAMFRNLLNVVVHGDVVVVSRTAVATSVEANLGWGTPTVILSEQEQLVMRRLAEGMPEKEIAQCEAMSRRTVERVVARLEAKLDAPTQFTLALRAMRLGLLQ